jgi:hypothetical protein
LTQYFAYFYIGHNQRSPRPALEIVGSSAEKRCA